ncbi:MAG: hypothetical protein R2867_36895 [Caldilineaceae bacterium]
MDKYIRHKITITIAEEWTVTWQPVPATDAGPVQTVVSVVPSTAAIDVTRDAAESTGAGLTQPQAVELDSTGDNPPTYLVLKRLPNGAGWCYLPLDQVCGELCESSER